MLSDISTCFFSFPISSFLEKSKNLPKMDKNIDEKRSVVFLITDVLKIHGHFGRMHCGVHFNSN